MPVVNITRRNAERLDKTSQAGRQSTWREQSKRELGRQKIEHSKKEDRIRGSNIPTRRTEDLYGTSHEGRQTIWIEHPKKEDRIPN
jgi:hypothetical protein